MSSLALTLVAQSPSLAPTLTPTSQSPSLSPTTYPSLSPHSVGIITTIVGTGTAGYSGDGGDATSATLRTPRGVALDSSGNVYIGDTGNAVVRKLTIATGKIATIAGTGISGSSGDGGDATSAKLNAPSGVAVDTLGNVYIGDQGNCKVRRVAVSTNIITTIAGVGGQSYSGDGGQASSAGLNYPYSVAVFQSSFFTSQILTIVVFVWLIYLRASLRLLLVQELQQALVMVEMLLLLQLSGHISSLSIKPPEMCTFVTMVTVKYAKLHIALA